MDRIVCMACGHVCHPQTGEPGRALSGAASKLFRPADQPPVCFTSWVEFVKE